MVNFFTISKNSYNLEEYEIRFIKLFLNYMKDQIPNGNGKFLDTLNLDKIKFKYCSAFNDEGILGAWTISSPNTIYLMSDYFGQENNAEQYNKKYSKLENNLILDFVKFKNISNIIGNNDYYDYAEFTSGNTSMIILHELYHKWQFQNATIFYILNFIVQLFVGYKLSCKLPFFIEGDVRKYIDNEENLKLMTDFIKLINYIISLNTDIILNNRNQERSLEFEKKLNTTISNIKSLNHKIVSLCINFFFEENILNKNLKIKNNKNLKELI